MVSRWTPVVSANRPIVIPGSVSPRMTVDSVVDYGIKLTLVGTPHCKGKQMASPFQRAAPLTRGNETGARKATPESAALAAGGIGALLAGACCVDRHHDAYRGAIGKLRPRRIRAAHEAW